MKCECNHFLSQHLGYCDVCGCANYRPVQIDPRNDPDESGLPGWEVRSDLMGNGRVW